MSAHKDVVGLKPKGQRIKAKPQDGADSVRVRRDGRCYRHGVFRGNSSTEARMQESKDTERKRIRIRLDAVGQLKGFNSVARCQRSRQARMRANGQINWDS